MPNDREEILNTLIRRVNSFADGYRQNIAIFGEPCIGKTTLIKNLFSSELLKKDSVVPAYLEIKIEPFEFCAKRFIKSILSQVVKSDPLLTSPQDAVLLIEDLARDYPKTAQICIRVLQDIEKSKLDEAFSFMLDIPSVLSEETKKRCILILDEFHNLDNFMLKNPFGTIAKKIMIQKDTMYILVSSRINQSLRVVNEKLALLFGNFEKFFLKPLDIAASRAFLQNNIKGSVLSQVYLDFVASFAGNRPFYMQAICDEIERAVFSKRIAPENYQDLIERSFMEALFKRNGILNQYFYNLLFKISEGKLLSKSISVLISLSSENKKQGDIAKDAKLQSGDVSKILNSMIELDIIARNGAFYRFTDRLFRFWLKSVYMKRISSFSLDENIEEAAFRKDVSNRFNVFAQEFEKELSHRIIELFKLFKNDIIQLNGKKHKFISFTNVEEFEDYSRSHAAILATNGRQKWLCTIKKENITENDMLDIIKNSRDQKKNAGINKNIVIAFSGVNENAYLMAKEAKFWTWSAEDLNVLMELYGKPHVSY
ncbi:MAG: ATP-binding protein [Candidatus Omnitrophica bacterium]|nr:ATP-binding protein [Candidatus Omnitrophota bacterium]